MIPAHDPDPELDFQLFDDSGSGFGYRTMRNCNTYRGVMTLALDPDPESEYLTFSDSGSRFRPSRKWNRNTFKTAS